MEIQPRIVALHKDLITRCLDANDEATRLLALDLLAALANVKTIDGIVARMFEHFKKSKAQGFRDQVMRRVIEICSKRDYDLVNDFEWYISVLMDFIAEAGFSCFDAVSEQFLDMALRVPDTRPRLVVEMGTLFENVVYKDATQLLLAASHIIAEYSTDSAQFDHVMQPLIANTDERVQQSAIFTTFRLFLRVDGQKADEIRQLFVTRLSLFDSSPFPEVQDCASLVNRVLEYLKNSKDGKARVRFQALLADPPPDEFDPLERPSELDHPIELFHEDDDKEETAEPIEVLPISSRRSKADSKGASKPRGTEIRRQSGTAAKPKILKLSAEKPVAPAQPKAAPAVLSPRLASVDLTEIIADEEAKNLPRPMPYVQTELMKNQQSAPAKRGHRHRASAAPPPKPPPSAPVTAPKPHSRLQPLGDNAFMLVNAVEFYCSDAHPRVLEVEFSLQNQSTVVLPAIDVTAESPKLRKTVGKGVCKGGIHTGERALFRVALELPDVGTAQSITVIFVPTEGGADTLQADLKVFPSFFLMPGDAGLAEEAQARTVHAQALRPKTAAKPKDILQCVVNVIRGTLLDSSNPHARTLYARSTAKEDVICTLQIEATSVAIELKASTYALAKFLIAEIDWRIKNMRT
jgi:hypothetical protein